METTASSYELHSSSSRPPSSARTSDDDSGCPNPTSTVSSQHVDNHPSDLVLSPLCPAVTAPANSNSSEPLSSTSTTQPINIAIGVDPRCIVASGSAESNHSLAAVKPVGTEPMTLVGSIVGKSHAIGRPPDSRTCGRGCATCRVNKCVVM